MVRYLPCCKFPLKFRSIGAVVGVARVNADRSRIGGLGEFDFRVDLLVQLEKIVLRLFVEAGDRHADRLRLVVEDRKRLRDREESPSGDNLGNATFEEGLADSVRPLDEVASEVLVFASERLHLLDDDTLLDTVGSVLLLKRHGEAVEERFVENAGVGEGTSIVALALGVGSGEHLKTGSGFHELVDLLEEDTLALKDRLQTHERRRTEVDFVEEKNGTVLHRLDNGTVIPDGLTVHKSKPAEQVILVGLRSDVDTIAFASLSGTRLHDHRGLTVTGKTSHEGRVESTRLDDRRNIVEVSPRHEVRVLGGNDRFARHKRLLEDSSRLRSGIANRSGAAAGATEVRSTGAELSPTSEERS